MSGPSLNPFVLPSLGMALDGPAKPKKRSSPNIKNYAGKLTRVAKKAPEVVVKVSGSGKRSGHILAHMTYITRNGKVEAENERGEKIKGLEEVKETFAEWGFQVNDSERRRAQTVNIVLSMPEGTDPQAVLAASREFAKEQFGDNHQYLMALHTDTAQPHVHLSVKAQGFDLTWLKRSKADLQEWREQFAQKMRDQGIDAEATPRRARGVVRKGKTQAMHHLAKEPKRSSVIKEKVDAAIREVHEKKPRRDRPWEEAIIERQRKVREAYSTVAQELRAARDQASHKAADQLVEFLRGLPPIETERTKLKRQLEVVMEGGQAEAPAKGPKSGRSAQIEPKDKGQGGRQK